MLRSGGLSGTTHTGRVCCHQQWWWVRSLKEEEEEGIWQGLEEEWRVDVRHQECQSSPPSTFLLPSPIP